MNGKAPKIQGVQLGGVPRDPEGAGFGDGGGRPEDLQVGIGLRGGETGNSTISNSLAGFVCSPPPSRADLVGKQSDFQPHGSPAVSFRQATG